MAIVVKGVGWAVVVAEVGFDGKGFDDISYSNEFLRQAVFQVADVFDMRKYIRICKGRAAYLLGKAGFRCLRWGRKCWTARMVRYDWVSRGRLEKLGVGITLWL